MSNMILALLDDPDMASKAVDELRASGYEASDISIVTHQMNEERIGVKGGRATSVAEGAGGGMATGGIIGGLAGLLIGVGAITIPGLGALLVGGPLAAALGLTGAAAATVSGAVTGALAGGLVGALVGLGVPEEDAREYEARIKEGATLVAVPTRDGMETQVRRILLSYGASQIRQVALARA